MRALLILLLVVMVPAVGDAQTLGRIQSTGAINVGYVPSQPPLPRPESHDPPVI